MPRWFKKSTKKRRRKARVVRNSGPRREPRLEMDDLLFTILIVNYNGSRHLGPCLSALEQQTFPQHRFEVVMVDNASRDNSCEKVSREFPWARIVKNSVNEGFAGGNNTGLPHAYYPDDDPARAPLNRWRSHAHLLFGNWINQVYQTTEYDLSKVGVPTKVLEEA